MFNSIASTDSKYYLTSRNLPGRIFFNFFLKFQMFPLTTAAEFHMIHLGPQKMFGMKSLWFLMWYYYVHVVAPIYNIRQQIRKDSFEWYRNLQQRKYGYVHQFKERINEILCYRKWDTIVRNNFFVNKLNQVKKYRFPKLNVKIIDPIAARNILFVSNYRSKIIFIKVIFIELPWYFKEIEIL